MWQVPKSRYHKVSSETEELSSSLELWYNGTVSALGASVQDGTLFLSNDEGSEIGTGVENLQHKAHGARRTYRSSAVLHCVGVRPDEAVRPDGE